jgi:hypothetical protein
MHMSHWDSAFIASACDTYRSRLAILEHRLIALFHTTICHIPDPERALGDAFRVLRPHGWLAVFDGDYATTTVAIGDFDPFKRASMLGSDRVFTIDGY